MHENSLQCILLCLQCIYYQLIVQFIIFVHPCTQTYRPIFVTSLHNVCLEYQIITFFYLMLNCANRLTHTHTVKYTIFGFRVKRCNFIKTVFRKFQPKTILFLLYTESKRKPLFYFTFFKCTRGLPSLTRWRWPTHGNIRILMKIYP